MNETEKLAFALLYRLVSGMGGELVVPSGDLKALMGRKLVLKEDQAGLVHVLALPDFVHTGDEPEIPLEPYEFEFSPSPNTGGWIPTKTGHYPFVVTTTNPNGGLANTLNSQNVDWSKISKVTTSGRGTAWKMWFDALSSYEPPEKG